MRLRLPSSLAGRLVAVATGLIAAAVLVATIVMGFILHRFVTDQVDQRLDAQAFAIASALRAGPPGEPTIGAELDAPPFDRPQSGWTWRVEGPRGLVATSRSLGPHRPMRLRRLGEERRPLPPPERREKDMADPGGTLVTDQRGERRARSFSVSVAGEDLTIVVSAPARAIAGPMRDALTPLVVSMLVLSLALIGATWLQVRLGLQPLAALRQALADVRAGRARHIPLDQPREIAPLSLELNSLIDENAAGLERARRHVANLAHGLKTPLAELALTLREPGRDPKGDAAMLVEDMDRRVRHHLARARAAAVSGGSARAATEVGPHVDDLVAVLGRIHAQRGLHFTIDMPEAAAVACEPQDLDEMLGNLLDNACKWAKTTVSIRITRSGGNMTIAIEDDGKGLAPGDLPEALQPGHRLDEMTPGHGFGLPIARELSELYGGGIEIGRSPLGGLSALLTLPVPGARAG